MIGMTDEFNATVIIYGGKLKLKEALYRVRFDKIPQNSKTPLLHIYQIHPDYIEGLRSGFRAIAALEVLPNRNQVAVIKDYIHTQGIGIPERGR